MADNININNGQASFFSVRKPAWHGLGKVVEEALTAEEAIVAAGLNYKVEKVNNYAKVGDGMMANYIINPESFSTIRTDNNAILGTVGSQYNVIQNTEAFDFFAEFAGKKAAIFETAGALGKGEVIFITAKIPDTLRIGKNDTVDEYLLLANSHDGSGKVRVLFTPIRVVCNNTLNMALKNYSMNVSIKHTNNAKDKLKSAHELLGIHKVSIQNRELIFNLLADSKLEDKVIYDIINYTFLTGEELRLVAANNNNPFTIDEVSTNKKNLIHTVRNYYHTGPGQDLNTTKGTAWGAINAITGYYQNAKPYSNNEDKLLDIMEGNAKTKVNTVFNHIYSLITN